MSRKITCARAGANPAAQGKLLGYDGIAILTSSCSGEAAGSLCQAFSSASAIPLPNGAYEWSGGADNGDYPIACDILRILYFGRDHYNSGDCNSQLRRTLVNTWGTLFEGAQTGTCTQLSHAFRLDDLSGTTDTLRSICGVPFTTQFCNGTSTQDNDPIRRAASTANYDISRADGSLGVVPPIAVPPSANAYSDGACAADSCGAGGIAAQCGTRCPTGVFAFKTVPGFGACPTGLPRWGGNCLVPVVSSGGTTSFRCVNAASNKPTGSSAVSDGRTFNTYPRWDDGSIDVGFVSAYYRTHESRAVVGSGCKEITSEQQIACLVRADQCAVGFAGRSALLEPNIVNVKLAPNGASSGTFPSACLSPQPGNVLGGTYPLPRRLYLNTLKGFANVTGQESNLASCFQDEAKVEAAISANNFIVDPAAGIQTENFSASNCFTDSPPRAAATEQYPLARAGHRGPTSFAVALQDRCWQLRRANLKMGRMLASVALSWRRRTEFPGASIYTEGVRCLRSASSGSGVRQRSWSWAATMNQF